MQRHGSELDPFAILALKRAGRYASTRDSVRRKRTLLRERGIDKPTLADARVDAETLQRWVERRTGRALTSPEEEAFDRGFLTLREWVDELIASYMANSDQHSPA